jgi:DNA repair protein RecN (Recombination protein N)
VINKLTIQNYALIEKLEINFSKKLTVITGETGAGKSIILGALGLLKGDRADVAVLFEKEKKCLVEADFNIEQLELKDFFIKHDLDYNSQCIIRREINVSGKSRAFINDTPVTLLQLKELGDSLIDLHKQQQTLELNSQLFQLKMIDSLAENNQVFSDYISLYKVRLKDKTEWNRLQEQLQLAQNEQEYNQFLLSELEAANLTTINQIELEAQLTLLNNSELIMEKLLASYLGLNNDEQSAISTLKIVLHQLNSIKGLHKDYIELYNRLQSIIIEAVDISEEIENAKDNLTFNPDELLLIQNKLDNVYRLFRKHNVTNVAELLALELQLNSKVNNVSDLEKMAEKIAAKINIAEKELQVLAKQLSTNRKKIVSTIEKNLTELCIQVGLVNAQIKINIIDNNPLELSTMGLDYVEILFSANKGLAPQPIHKAASGGELSRLMLCIKSLLANKVNLPTMIFDEIDTGVSGQVAIQVGQLLKKLSDQHQIMVISHLPQIAAFATEHLWVYKNSENTKTTSHIKLLADNERLHELAIMLSGNPPSKEALANAQSLIQFN